jgi:hypothetical protein
MRNQMDSMRNQMDNWLVGDWVVLGGHVPHWAAVIAALIVVALLVAWFERPRRTPARPSPRSRATGPYEASAFPER